MFGGCGRSCAPDKATTVVDRTNVAAVVRAGFDRKSLLGGDCGQEC